MKELPKKWRVVLTATLFLVPVFTALRGIGTEKPSLIVSAIWFYLIGGLALNRVTPEYKKDGTKVENKTGFIRACQDKELWKRGFKQYWMIDLCALSTCYVLLQWGMHWMGVLGLVLIVLAGKIEQSRRELDELRSRQ
ncbi:hypothetical protein LCM27_15520 [Ruegeria marisrubri]|uniref:hypothetical protein n=1 Tax=Ruegeria marisrubri TaxID=1685379 RepID=UPI001CD2DCCD|nr:hypothetical protein [Ruegeria marisrubri]MCA0907809.1 hypothetical protein [Ruegeria marisrubri]